MAHVTYETLVNSGLLIFYFNFRSTKVEGKVFLMFLFTFYKNREQVEDIPCMCMHKYMHKLIYTSIFQRVLFEP